MNEKIDDPLGMTSMLTTWMKTMGDFWGNADGHRGASPGKQQADCMTGSGATPNAQAAMAAALKNWQTMAGAMSTPESVDSIFKGSSVMPDVLIKLAQTSMGSLIELQQSIIQRIGRIGESAKAYQFKDINENICRMLTDIYEKEFRQFFQIPQLGLMRTYQEKANLMVDRYNLFQSTLSEFLSLLCLPFTRSMQAVQEKMGEMAEKGEFSDNTKHYYNMWIKELEGYFMTLFQTSEYIDVLARTINALVDFSAARNAVFEDLLNLLPVAKKTDMDDMARELHEVKKRLRQLEKTS